MVPGFAVDQDSQSAVGTWLSVITGCTAAVIPVDMDGGMLVHIKRKLETQAADAFNWQVVLSIGRPIVDFDVWCALPLLFGMVPSFIATVVRKNRGVFAKALHPDLVFAGLEMVCDGL